MVYVDDLTTKTQLASTIPDLNATISEAFNTTYLLVQEVNNEELHAAFTAYRNQSELLQENISATARAIKSSNFAGAISNNDKMRDIVTTLQEYQTTFATVLTTCAQEDAHYGASSVIFIRNISAVLNVMILIVEVLLILMIQNTVIKPLRASTKKLHTIVDGIQTGEGNLTERRQN